MAGRRMLKRAVALVAALLAAACHPAPKSAEAEPGVRQFAPDPALAVETRAGFPQWAYPGTVVKSLPGSPRKYGTPQMYDRTAAVDWYPASHPAMPDIVKGHTPTYACGFCHLPQGAGRPENAALAGLPERYIVEQVHDFKAGLRRSPDRTYGPATAMEATAAQVSDADIAAAAGYFSRLTYRKHLKVVETGEVPHFTAAAFIYRFDPSGPAEPLGQRIIEGAQDFTRFELRDPNAVYVAYVPKGAVAEGAALAKGDGAARPACATCHGAGLKGGEIAPPLAGRGPTTLFRQLYAFQAGTRHGAGAAMMQPVVAGLSHKDMIDLAAYLASLEP